MTDHKLSPAARHVICVDFDDCISPWGPLYSQDDPFPGVVEAMQRLHDEGYRIVIFTSRLSHEWAKADHDRFKTGSAEDFINMNRLYLRDYLREWKIPYDLITAEKVPAELYLDDRALFVAPGNLGPTLQAWLDSRP